MDVTQYTTVTNLPEVLFAVARITLASLSSWHVDFTSFLV